ncbi:hypothetical protein ACIBG8_07280 [Nonomuraea sp. NPDC050556]|uniref:hypothetical protein n=1 Tax=Nonomuraea sp. NPDC050556 TaxID=3364369 RepID=UPI0037B4972B
MVDPLTIAMAFWQLVLKGAEAATGKYIERRLDAKGAIDLSDGAPLTVRMSVRLAVREPIAIQPHWVLFGLKSREGPTLTIPLLCGRPHQVKIPFQISGYDVFALFLDSPRGVSDRPTIRAAILDDHIFHVGDEGKYHKTIQALDVNQAALLGERIAENQLPFTIPPAFTMPTRRALPSGPVSDPSHRPSSPGDSSVDTPNRGSEENARRTAPSQGKASTIHDKPSNPNPIEIGSADEGAPAAPKPKRKRRRAESPHDDYISPENFSVERYVERPWSEEDLAALDMNLEGRQRSVIGYSSRGCMTYKQPGKKCDHSPAHGYLVCKEHLHDLYEGAILESVDSDGVFMM